MRLDPLGSECSEAPSHTGGSAGGVDVQNTVLQDRGCSAEHPWTDSDSQNRLMQSCGFDLVILDSWYLRVELLFISLPSDIINVPILFGFVLLLLS